MTVCWRSLNDFRIRVPERQLHEGVYLHPEFQNLPEKFMQVLIISHCSCIHQCVHLSVPRTYENFLPVQTLFSVHCFRNWCHRPSRKWAGNQGVCRHSPLWPLSPLPAYPDIQRYQSATSEYLLNSSDCSLSTPTRLFQVAIISCLYCCSSLWPGHRSRADPCLPSEESSWTADFFGPHSLPQHTLQYFSGLLLLLGQRQAPLTGPAKPAEPGPCLPVLSQLHLTALPPPASLSRLCLFGLMSPGPLHRLLLLVLPSLLGSSLL